MQSWVSYGLRLPLMLGPDAVLMTTGVASALSECHSVTALDIQELR
eukprot:CAMPEP_0174307814 /NCGR_PEP_ID=MMETSP0810-20121108/1355_1 /TAXON_ID=73025 ORGANISM="Eutreptiella gymnastica-like, Strain CCMP1594" /NCGR_SAMPLE_ID=MMETSP0810 /ASSEMBLY_ACC=CAM_ASM_000659 /LENGTH=45 /DNA_ID= /DNA_START= /DNA_END= /DNA_ORIENTATION=